MQKIQRSLTEERALALLGSGLGPEVVSNAIGVSISRISQLLAEEDFSSEVAKLRFESLHKHNERDNKIDALEDTLLDKIRDLLPMMYKPMEIIRAYAIVNAAKRRGQASPDQITHQATVVNLVLPQVIHNRFTTDLSNQVIEVISDAESKPLITAQITSIEEMAAKKKDREKENKHVLPRPELNL